MPEVRPGDRFNDWEIVTPLVRQHNQRALCLCHGCGTMAVRDLRSITSGRSRRCIGCAVGSPDCGQAYRWKVAGLRYREIADRQGTSVSTAYRRVLRGFREERSNALPLG